MTGKKLDDDPLLVSDPERVAARSYLIAPAAIANHQALQVDAATLHNLFHQRRRISEVVTLCRLATHEVYTHRENMSVLHPRVRLSRDVEAVLLELRELAKEAD